MLSRDIEAYDAYADRTAPDECPVCGVDCRCSGPYVGEDVASACVAAANLVDEPTSFADGINEPFCSCGRRWSQCDGSRRGCGKEKH